MHVSTKRLLRAATAAALAVLTVSTSTAHADATAAASTQSAPPVRLELLQPSPEDAAAYARAGVSQVTLELGWDAYEPTAGVLNTEYLDRRRAEATAYQAVGIDVVLDLGLQYPPAWVWNLPGGTRFVNQFGDTWHGTTGTDALNAVWNRAARTAQQRAITSLAKYFTGTRFAAVRVGGLLSGELRLPPTSYNGRSGSLWGFDASARAASPIPAYRPGSGTTAQASTWLNWYLQSLTDYQTWLTSTVHSAFPTAELHVLLPGWGLRPGDAQRAVNARLSAKAVAASGDSLSAAIDWARQVQALTSTRLPVLLTTTWLDAPSYGTSTRDMAPVEYLVTLARPAGLPVSGENTGGGGQAALQRTVDQARRFGLTQATWMSAAQLRSGPLTLQQVANVFAGTA